MFQDFWLTGSRFYFLRDTDGVNTYPMIDFGRIEPMNPNIQVEKLQLEDSDGGKKVVVDEQLTKYTEEYDIKCSNLNMDNLTIFFAGKKLETYTRVATPVVGTFLQKAYKGRLLPVRDNTGEFVFGVTSIQAVTKSPTTPLVLGTDYEVVSLERGLIRIISGGLIVDGDEVKMSYTPRAFTAEERLIYPQTASAIKGMGLIVWGRGSNAQQTVREARVSLTPSASNIGIDNYSDITFKATVLSDVTKTNDPAGRLLYWLGTLPAKS